MLGTVQAVDIYVNEVYLPEVHSVQFKTSENKWYILDEAVVGKAKYDKMYAALLTALANSKRVWIGTKSGAQYTKVIDGRSVQTVGGMTIKR